VIIRSYEIERKTTSFLKYNFFLLYGENIGLKKDIRDKIKIEINKKENNTELLSFDESEIIDNEEIFYNSIYSGSLFSNKKIITVNDGTDKILKYVEDIYKKYPENIILVIFSDILEKKSKMRIFFEKNSKTACVPCYLDSTRDLEIILINELKKNNITASRESINVLVEKSNNDRNNLKNEIEKIKAFAFNKKSLDIEEMKSIVNFSGEYKSDSLINECLSGDITQYKKIIAELYVNTVNHIFLLRILYNKIQKLLDIKKLGNDSKDIDGLINSARPPIFWKDKPVVKKQLSIWGLSDLTKIVNEINNIELLCKKNPLVAKTIFFNFCNKLCKKASNYS
jgi:DNA polymerase-3 subunit delta|tara:strand:+ start:202 stop:1221 length:1020 start_codon:yes stop_codon:yes gene_type:complete